MSKIFPALVAVILIALPIPALAQFKAKVGEDVERFGLKELAPDAAQPAKTVFLDEVIGRDATGKAKVVWISFFASWCHSCRKEFPSLGRVRKLFKPTEFEVIAVNVGEDPETVFSFAGAPDFPVLFDRDSQAMARWPVKGLPTTLVVDRQGRLALRAVGGREFDDPAIVEQLRELLMPRST